MPRAVYRHRMTIQRRKLLDEDDYYEQRYTDYETVYEDVPCLATPDTRPVAILNAEISEPNRDITRLYWVFDIGEFHRVGDASREKISLYAGDRIVNVVDRRGDAVIANPINVIVAGPKWDGWRLLGVEHQDRDVSA